MVPPTKKALGLIAYLALEGPASRARLADLLWSENDEESARHNLRVELHRLRKTVLRDYLHADEKTVGLRGPLDSDVAQFQALLERGEVEGALELYRGPLLAELELPGATGFAEWLEGWREQLGRQRRRALLYRAENLEIRGDWRGALEIHLQLLAEDDLQERHHREVMRLHYLLGEREAALERFERLKGTLRQELGLEPLPETADLARQIRSAQALSPPVVAPQTPTLAVPLRAREEAWERIEAAWAARQLVVLTGEPGVGKSRLARDFALSKGPLQTNQGRPTDLGVPFATLSRAVREMLQENPGLELPAWARLELSRLVADLAQIDPASLSNQAGLKLLAAVAQEKAGGLEEAQATREFLGDVLGREGQDPGRREFQAQWHPLPQLANPQHRRGYLGSGTTASPRSRRGEPKSRTRVPTTPLIMAEPGWRERYFWPLRPAASGFFAKRRGPAQPRTASRLP